MELTEQLMECVTREVCLHTKEVGAGEGLSVFSGGRKRLNKSDLFKKKPCAEKLKSDQRSGSLNNGDLDTPCLLLKLRFGNLENHRIYHFKYP